MKLTLIAAVSVLSTLASGLALPDLTPRAITVRPSIAIVIKEDSPTTAFPPASAVEVSRTNGGHTVKTLLGFPVPGCTGTCTFSFNGSNPPSGSRTLQLYTSGGFPTNGNTWNSHPFTNKHIGTFLVPASGVGPATVLEDFGLTFTCPTTTTGYEVQPVNDNDSVTWDITTGGFILTCT